MRPRPGHPGAPKKTLAGHAGAQAASRGGRPRPALEGAEAGDGHALSADAAGRAFGPSPRCRWPFVRAPSGRQRVNALGAWDAATVGGLPRAVAAGGLTDPGTAVVDDARYRERGAAQDGAKSPGRTPPSLPGGPPSLNLTERLWRPAERDAP